jgi:hypothetical protein
MNERIKELWEQSRTSGVHPKFGDYDKYSVEKFAELIVRECADIAKTAAPYSSDDLILKRFGFDDERI